MKRTIEIKVSDDLNIYVESLAKFLKTKPDIILRRAVADAVKSIPDNVEKHIDPQKLKKIYKLIACLTFSFFVSGARIPRQLTAIAIPQRLNRTLSDSKGYDVSSVGCGAGNLDF